MKYSVTQKDKKAVKATCIVLAFLLLILTTLSIVFGIITPKAEEIKSLGGQKILGQVEGKDGSDYFLRTKDALYRYDAYTSDRISVFYFKEIEDMLADDGISKNDLIAESLNDQWQVTYVGAGEEDYFLAADINGNLFKLKDDGEKLSVTKDYLLATRKMEIKGIDDYDGKLYMVVAEGNDALQIRQYDFLNLKDGAKAQKTLWEMDLANTETPVGYITVKPMSGQTGILSFTVTKDTMYVFKDGGTVVKLTSSLADYVENGVGYNYLDAGVEGYGIINKAVEEYKQSDEYKTVYERTYTEEVRKLVKEWYPENYAEANGDSLTTSDELLAVAKAAGMQDASINREKSKWEKKANEAVSNSLLAVEEEVKASVLSQYPWYGGYVANERSVHVSIRTLNANNDYYSIVDSGANLCGITYSKKNDIIYWTNGLDGYVYSVTQKAINEAKMLIVNEDATKKPTLTTLSDIAERIDDLYFGNKMFKEFGNGISINKFANTLYLTFQNEQVVKIVDLNDTENYEIIYSFTGDFNIISFIGDKDNKVTHVIREYNRWDKNGNPDNVNYAATYKPAQFEKKSLLSTLFVISLILAIVVALLLVWFFIASRSERALMKMKFIKEDLRKHKWIYISLIPFVILLIMFCYYEAIGAIAMSFFNYTQKEPAWIWNDFGNYIRLFNSDLLKMTWNTLFFLVFDLIFCLAPPLLFAFMLVLLRNQKLSGWFRSLMFLPGIIPSMAGMMLWKQGIFAADGGVLNQIVEFFGGKPVNWLINEQWSRWSLLFMGFPFVGGYLIFYGGMINIPGEYHEAGRLEGLGAWKRLFCIDIPLIMPQIKYIFVMTIIDSVQNYSRTYVMKSSGTKTLAEGLYRAMQDQTDYGLSSAYAMLIFACLFMAIAANFKMQKKDTMGDGL